MAFPQAENTDLVPETISEIPPPSEKPHLPSPKRHVGFTIDEDLDESDSNRSPAIISDETTASTENADVRVPEKSTSTFESVFSEMTLRPVSIRPSPSAANLLSSYEMNGSTGNSNSDIKGDTPKSGGAVKSNGNGNHQQPVAEHPMVADAWDLLKKSIVYFNNDAVGTVAASDTSSEALNYNQVYFPSRP